MGKKNQTPLSLKMKNTKNKHYEFQITPFKKKKNKTFWKGTPALHLAASFSRRPATAANSLRRIGEKAMLRNPTTVRTLRNLMENKCQTAVQQKLHFHYNHTDSCKFSRWTARQVYHNTSFFRIFLGFLNIIIWF